MQRATAMIGMNMHACPKYSDFRCIKLGINKLLFQTFHLITLKMHTFPQSPTPEALLLCTLNKGNP